MLRADRTPLPILTPRMRSVTHARAGRGVERAPGCTARAARRRGRATRGPCKACCAAAPPTTATCRAAARSSRRAGPSTRCRQRGMAWDAGCSEVSSQKQQWSDLRAQKVHLGHKRGVARVAQTGCEQSRDVARTGGGSGGCGKRARKQGGQRPSGSAGAGPGRRRAQHVPIAGSDGVMA
jgi:hypothetical protein